MNFRAATSVHYRTPEGFATPTFPTQTTSDTHLNNFLVFVDWLVSNMQMLNPFRSVSSRVCVFVLCCGKPNGHDSCILTN